MGTTPSTRATRSPDVTDSDLLGWLADPSPQRGMRFADDAGGWTQWSYARLAGLVAGAAEQIAELRHARDGVVSIVAPSGPEFAVAFMGVLAAGNTPSPLQLPLFVRERAAAVAHVASILRTAQPVLVVADGRSDGIVEEAAQLAGLAGRVAQIAPREGTPAVLPLSARPKLALLQFTSGSSGEPRAVRVTWGNLEGNVTMIRRWLEVGSEAATATWLPLYHDMGLIGGMITPTVHQSDVWVMRPDQFVRDPVRWLECYGRHGVQIGVAPNFGFAYANKRLADEQLEPMDFSEWRVAIVGAERLDADVLGRFARRLAPYGFRASTFLPAYGLAEGTLAVTGAALAEEPRVVRPDWAGAEFGRPLEVLEQTSLTDGERIGAGAGWLVGCGRPHAEVGVAIVGEEGELLPEGSLGEIVVTGPTVSAGYVGTPSASTRFDGARVLTGDAGFLLDGELFVMGRLGDSLKVRGRTVFVEDLEARAAALGVPRGKCVVLAGTRAGANALCALVELPPGPWVEQVAALLERESDRTAHVTVLCGEPGAIDRTSSGKPRRRVMWQWLERGELGGQVVYDSQSTRGANR